MPTQITWALYSDSGVPLVGATPSFADYATRAGVSRSPPAIVDLGSGQYGFTPSEGDLSVGVAYLVDNGLGSNPRRVSGAASYASAPFVVWHLESDDGSLWSGAAPTISSYRSSAGARTPASVMSVRTYLFALTPTTDDVLVGVTFVATSPAGAWPLNVQGSFGTQGTPLTDMVAFATVEDVRADLGIQDTLSDSRIARRILAASSLIEAYCCRAFRRSTNKTEKVAGYGTQRMLLSLTPISSVTQITYDGSIVSSDLYEIEQDSDGNGWCVYAPGGWTWTAPGMQLSSNPPEPLPGMERQLYEVQYSGGYCLPNDLTQSEPYLPPGIKEACIMLSCHLWRQAGRDGNIISESVGGASVQYGYIGGVDSSPANHGGIPGWIAAMLHPYKRAV